MGEWRGAGRGTVAAKGPHPHTGIEGTDSGHLGSGVRLAPCNRGRRCEVAFVARAPCITSNTED